MQSVNSSGITRLSRSYISDGRILCHQCGVRNLCTDFAATECEEFMETLSFRPPLKGFEDEFNTIRLGKAWASRARVDDVVALQNGRTKEVFGYAKIQSIHVGDRDEMVRLHAANNHAIRALNLPKEDQAERSLKRLRNAYGKRVFDRSAEATVVYLSMCESPE